MITQREALLNLLAAAGGQGRFVVEERVGTLTPYVFYQKHPAHSKQCMVNVKKAGPHSIRSSKAGDLRTDLIFGHFASRQSAKEVNIKFKSVHVGAFRRRISKFPNSLILEFKRAALSGACCGLWTVDRGLRWRSAPTPHIPRRSISLRSTWSSRLIWPSTDEFSWARRIR